MTRRELNTNWWRPSRKSPHARRRRGCFFSSPSTVVGRPDGGLPVIPRRETGSVAEFAADDVAEQFPFLALEPHHLKLLDRSVIGCAGIDLDSRQQGVGRKVLQARRLFH